MRCFLGSAACKLHTLSWYSGFECLESLLERDWFLLNCSEWLISLLICLLALGMRLFSSFSSLFWAWSLVAWGLRTAPSLWTKDLANHLREDTRSKHSGELLAMYLSIGPRCHLTRSEYDSISLLSCQSTYRRICPMLFYQVTFEYLELVIWVVCFSADSPSCRMPGCGGNRRVRKLV